MALAKDKKMMVSAVDFKKLTGMDNKELRRFRKANPWLWTGSRRSIVYNIPDSLIKKTA